MATNPNAIFSEALATGPRQIPLSELQNQIAQTRQTQAQTANIGSQMAQRQQETLGLQQQNTLRQRQIEDDQAVRDTIAKYTKTVPVTAPNVSMPPPGVDQNGNPLPISSAQHAQAAAGAVQAPHVDYDGAYLDLLQQGRIGAADTLRKSHQALETQDLENNKLRLENFEKQNQRRNEIVAPVVNAPPEQQDLLAAEAGQTLQNEGLGGGVGFTKEQARDLYQRTSGLIDPITKANAELDLKRAQTANIGAETRKTAAEAGMSERELKLMDQALANPEGMGSLVDAQIDPDKYPEINARTRAAYRTAMLLGGPKAAQQVLNGATTHINTLEEDISKATDPAIIAAAGQKAGAEERARQNVATQFITAAGSAGSALAKDVADYRIPIQSALARTPLPARDALMAQVNALNPDFNASNYAVKQRTEQDAITGKIGTQRGALNTMMGHLAILNQAADALNNSDFPALNRIANAVGVQVGNNAKTTYQTIVNRIGPEVTKAYIAGGGTSGERGTNEQDFSPNLAPAQIKANIGVSAQLAGSLIDSLKDRYQGGTFGRGNLPSLVSPEAEAARQRLAGQSPVSGGVRRVTTKAEYDALPAGTPYVDSKGNQGVKGKK